MSTFSITRRRSDPGYLVSGAQKSRREKPTLPQEILGPSFNDEFGDVFGIIYAFTADGFTHRELRDYVERIRTQVLTIKNAAKAQLVGSQDQKFYLEFDTSQLAGLGVSRDQVISSLQEQNAVTPSGVVQTGLEKYAIRVSGAFNSVDDLKRINLFANGKFFRLADVATIKKGYADPPQPMFRFNGEPGIGLATSMAQAATTSSSARRWRTRWSRSSSTCRSVSRQIWSPTSRWWSRKPSAVSRRHCGKRSQSSWR
jgi:multidrug efflux pump subunit AcrB